MTVMARNRTYAALAAAHPQPAPVYSQTELRERRRTGLTVTLGGGWSLAGEIAAVCQPLTALDQPRPLSYGRCVDDIADAVHALVHEAVSLLARADAERRTRHLGVDERGRSIRAIVDLTPRPALPDITDAMLADGSWAAVLTALADPYSAELADLLGRAATTAVSDRLLAALRDVDRAALTLARRLDRGTQAPATTPPPPTETDRARAELESLGVTL